MATTTNSSMSTSGKKNNKPCHELFAKISNMKSDNLYCLEYSDYCLHCYTHDVLANVSFGLPQIFHAEFRSLHRTLN